jgi:DNA-binding LacI/PurR family transcriptional regulator
MPRATRTKTRRVGLVISHSLGYYREILRGVERFAEARPGSLFISSAPNLRAVVALQSARLDGIIAHVFNRDLGTALAWVGRPVVNVSGVLPDLPFS